MSDIRNLNAPRVFSVVSFVVKVITSVFFFQVEVMMQGIIRAFKDRVSGVGWIDKQTVEAVREKVLGSLMTF